VRDRRLALGYSLGQLATKVNKTAASIRGWEKGESFPDMTEAVALAAALDLDAKSLVELIPEDATAATVADDPAAGEPIVDPWTPPAEESAVEDAATGDVDDEVGDEPGAATEEDSDLSSEAAVPAAEENAAEEDLADEVFEEPRHASTAEPQAAEADAGQQQRAEKASPAWEAPSEGSGVASTVHEAMTEAVPVVPAGAVAVAAPKGSLDRDLAAATADRFATGESANPVVQAWDAALAWYRRIFDPSRRWIYRVRYVLLLIAFLVMLRVLGWALSNLWDAIQEVLDSISFSPTENPDVAN